jgi:hypothetical protein
MTEQLLHDVLGDAAVDQPGPQGVAELVTGHGDRLAGLVAQVDDALPVRELLAEGPVRVGLGAVVVAGDPGEQPRAARGPVPQHVVLLGADRRRGLGAERDQLLGPDLGGLEPQARPAGAVIEGGAERQAAGVAAAQPGLDQDHDQVAGGGEREPVQGGGGLELGHHELGDEPGYLVVVVGQLFGVDDGVMGQSGQPAVAVAGVGEHPQHAERQRPGGSRVALSKKPRQVILQDRPGNAGLVGDAGVTLGQERREPGQGQCPGRDGRERAPGGQPEPGPPFRRVAQPVLGDGIEPGRPPPAAGWNAQTLRVPVVAGILAVEVGGLAVNQHRAGSGRGGARGGAHLGLPV